MGPGNGHSEAYAVDPPLAGEDRTPMHQQVAELGRRLAEVEDYLRRTQEFMVRISRELGLLCPRTRCRTRPGLRTA